MKKLIITRKCKCGHDIMEHIPSNCDDEVGGFCVEHIHGGQCSIYKCKCKKFKGVKKQLKEQKSWKDGCKDCGLSGNFCAKCMETKIDKMEKKNNKIEEENEELWKIVRKIYVISKYNRIRREIKKKK